MGNLSKAESRNAYPPFDINFFEERRSAGVFSALTDRKSGQCCSNDDLVPLRNSCQKWVLLNWVDLLRCLSGSIFFHG